MKIEKIDVQTLNKKHATDIAMLVDKREFLQEIQRLRGKWEITDHYKGKSDRVNERSLYSCTKLSQAEAERRLPEFKADIDSVLDTFNRGKNFRLLVVHALITGVIPEGLYQSCYFDIVTINEKENINKPEKYQYVIVMSPRTEQQEVLQAYKEFKDHIKGHEATNENEMDQIGKIKFHELSKNHKFSMEDPDDVAIIEHYSRGNVYSSANIDKFKTQKELERTREWYWIAYADTFNELSTKRKRSEDILTEWQLQKCPVKTAHADIESKMECPYCSVENTNDIDQALPTYVKLLNQS